MDRPYVYALIDPRDGATFYVGKGSGLRMYQHQHDVRAGRVVNQAKTERIQQILAAGQCVRCAVLSEHDTDAQAYEAEKAEIASRTGLTNMRAGGAGPSSFACPPDSAASLLARVKPYMDWMNERPRTNLESALYLFVESSLRAMAKC